MNDPQIWTLIGVFAAVMLGGFTLVSTLLTQVIRAESGKVRSELGGEVAGVRSEIAGVRSEIVGVRSEIVALNKRFDHVDRDVQSLSERIWRTGTDT